MQNSGVLGIYMLVHVVCRHVGDAVVQANSLQANFFRMDAIHV